MSTIKFAVYERWGAQRRKNKTESEEELNENQIKKRISLDFFSLHSASRKLKRTEDLSLYY
jgi:hypothetical protein